MNRVVLIGRLTKDPELRATQSGKEVVEFSIAVNKRIKPTDGSADADFFRVKAWGQTAGYVNNYLNKGRLVAIDGRIETRKFTDKDGNNREVVEIVADNVNGLDKPKDDDNQQAQSKPNQRQASRPTAPAQDEYDPFADE